MIGGPRRATNNEPRCDGRSSVGRLLSSLAAFAMLSCTAHEPARSSGGQSGGHCHYDVAVRNENSALLDVEARCPGEELWGFIARSESRNGLSNIRDLAGHPLSRASPASHAVEGIRYSVDLDLIAQQDASVDTALRMGHSWIAPASTWLLEPQTPNTLLVELRVKTPDRYGFVSGLTWNTDHYELSSREIRVATYSVFGKFETHPIELSSVNARRPARRRLVQADAPLKIDADALQAWARDSAQAVSQFFGGFPVERSLLLIIPKPKQRTVSFGKLLPESSPGIVLEVGQEAKLADLRQDWILVHELFHLGFPSFIGEGKWLDEGLATYYEPIIRARAGFLSETELWLEFARGMPSGLYALEKVGLATTESQRAMYWGGAVFCFLADLEIRTRTHGKLGLENGLRAVLEAGGNATEVWSLNRVLGVIDDALGAPIVRRLAEKYAFRAGPVALEQKLNDLGVHRTAFGVELRDDAPLSELRKTLVMGRSL